jgi:hypothetical protein
MKTSQWLSLWTFAVAVSAAAVDRNTEGAPKFNIVHKEMPADALPKPSLNKDPVVLSQKAIDYLNAMPESNIESCPLYTDDPNSARHACQWDLYQTSTWMDEYIANLLAYYNKTSTNDLDYYWLEYLWNDYSGTGQQWGCVWREGQSEGCNKQPKIPATDASINYINAYFVLRSFNHWDSYMRVHIPVLQQSRFAFSNMSTGNQGLAGTYNNFKSDENKWPANPQPYDPASLVNTITFVLSSIPSSGHDTALPCVDFGMGFVPTPEVSEPLPDSGLEGVTNHFNKILTGWEKQFENTHMTALNYQEFLMPLLRKGAFLEEVKKETTEEWKNIHVFP